MANLLGEVLTISIRNLFFLLFFICIANNSAAIECNEEPASPNIVLLVVDGLGASYIYPEYHPKGLDDTILQKPEVSNLSLITSKSIRFSDVSTITLSGNSGHDVLVTGNQNADEKMMNYPGTTIYDILHDYGYVTIAIMEKGDSPEIIAKQDLILHDTTNSINDVNLSIKFQQNSDHENLYKIRDVLEIHAQIAPGLVEGTKKGSIERYHAYNKIVFSAADDVILKMEGSDVPYILTLNVGAIDSAGHYRGNEGYIQAIEGLDSMILPLYEVCKEKGIVLVITSDHGIAFPDSERRGGVQSGDYPDTSEVKRIPLIIYSPCLDPTTIDYPADQQDIAPTILSLLDIPENPHFCEGKRFEIKDYATLKVVAENECSVRILSAGKTIYSSGNGLEHYFKRLGTDTNYTLIVFDKMGNLNEERQFSLNKDSIIYISADTSESSTFSKDWMDYYGYAFIALINLSGIGMIFRVLKQ